MADAVENKGTKGFAHVPTWNAPPTNLTHKTIRYFASLFGEGFLWSMKSVFILTALLSYYVLTPADADYSQFSLSEAAWLAARNFGLMIICAGGLHWYFHTATKQGKAYRYFRQPLSKSTRFLFGNQVWDNMFWSLISGVTIWTLNEAAYLWLYDGGILWRANFGESLWESLWFIALFILIPHIQAIHFYIIHIFLHWPPAYKHVHALHHRNVNLGPWSGISMHPAEHLIYLCPWLVFLVLPSHPLHLFFFMHYLTLGAAFSHSGFERLKLWGNATFPIAGFYHQLHHRFYTCNYGNPDFPLDKMFGSNMDVPDIKNIKKHR